LPFWNLLLWSSAKRSRDIIAVSEATQRDLRKYYEVDSTVVHHGVDPKFFDIANRRSPEDFLLCVSTLHPHKNIDRLVRAFATFREANPGIRLVLAGMRGFYTETIEAEIRRLGLKESVEVTGWLEQDDLFDLYRRARAFVYPSRFEGFGMPVLEALAAGIPLACSNIEPMRSLVQDDAILFDPESDETVAAALNQLISKAPAPNQRIHSFTWRKTAEDTLRVLIR
jgi:glycosyltransferase involved in cell wall biosynthesis